MGESTGAKLTICPLDTENFRAYTLLIAVSYATSQVVSSDEKDDVQRRVERRVAYAAATPSGAVGLS